MTDTVPAGGQFGLSSIINGNVIGILGRVIGALEECLIFGPGQHDQLFATGSPNDLRPAHTLAPPVSRRGSATDVDCQDRNRILVEDHPIAADAEPEAVAALKGPHVALARHGVAVKPSFHPLASISGKGIEILRRAQRQDDRFHER
jgi:hypothetical protein